MARGIQLTFIGGKSIMDKRKWTVRLALGVLGLSLCMGAAHAQTKLRLGYLPIGEDTPKFVGHDKGVFRKHGLEIELVRFESGPDQGTALLGGSIQIGTVGTPGLIFTAIAGRPLLTFFDNGSNRMGPAGYEYYTGLVTLDESPIKNFGDLKGKKVAVNVLKSNSEIQTVLQAERWNKEHPGTAVDINKDIQFVILPFGAMPAALQKGIVDVVSLIEPYTTQLSASRKMRVVAPVSYALPNWPIGLGATRTDYARKNVATLRQFRAAWSEAVQWIRDNPDEAKSIMQKYTGVAPEVATKITLPTWSDDMKAITRNAELIMEGMLAAGMIKEKVKLDDYIIDDLSRLER
jgi:NitT/TauT family transport system substrate-binding protein